MLQHESTILEICMPTGGNADVFVSDARRISNDGKGNFVRHTLSPF